MSRAALHIACACLAAVSTADGLTACTTVRPTAPVCVPVKAWSPTEMTALAAQLQAIATGSPIDLAMQDYERTRDAERACGKAAS